MSRGSRRREGAADLVEVSPAGHVGGAHVLLAGQVGQGPSAIDVLLVEPVAVDDALAFVVQPRPRYDRFARNGSGPTTCRVDALTYADTASVLGRGRLKPHEILVRKLYISFDLLDLLGSSRQVRIQSSPDQPFPPTRQATDPSSYRILVEYRTR
jgi:hypothetical protein